MSNEVKKMKVMTVVGTRPEIIRLSRVLAQLDEHCEHILVHTGQNYDYELNEIFFDDLEIRKPDFFLNSAGLSGAETIGNVIIGVDRVLAEVEPEALLVLGDTNSCMAVVPAKRRKIPIFHMEAGNRCFDMRVPEEINRRIVDHTADINLTYSSIARDYLLAEGLLADSVIKTGSPMYEVLNYYRGGIDESTILSNLSLTEHEYFVISAHREENVDSDKNFSKLVAVLNDIAGRYDLPVIVSTHPRTQKRIDESGCEFHDNVKLIKPLSFTDYVKLQIDSFVVLSDSGTISEESAIMRFPAVSVRTSTERPEAMDFGSIVLGNIDEDSMVQSVELAVKTFSEDHLEIPNEYQTENVSTRILKVIQGYTSVVNRETWRK